MTNVFTANAELLPRRVEKAAQDRIDAGAYQTLVFGVAVRDKSEVLAFGKLDDGRAPDGNTVYEIGSITKTFSATLLANEVLCRRFTLDTTVTNLLSNFKIPERNGKKITLGEIAMHYSGLPRQPFNMVLKDPANPYADYDAEKLKAFLSDYELPRDPGASFEYSNLGFGLLGHALAQSARTTYGALLDQKIFQPLGMTMSGTVFNDAMRTHLALGHDDTGNPVTNWDHDALAGAGAIRSTVSDMLRYLKANMGVNQTPLKVAMKFAQQPRRDMNEKMRIGLAWITTNQAVTWHNGGTGGYASFLGLSADKLRGVVILTNTAAYIDDLGFAALLDDAALTPAYKAVTLPSASLEGYVGTYGLADNFLLNVFRVDDRLYAQATGQAAFSIFPSAPNEFFAKVAGISISFMRDEKGAVTQLVLHQNGDRPAPKLSAPEMPPERK